MVRMRLIFVVLVLAIQCVHAQDVSTIERVCVGGLIAMADRTVLQSDTSAQSALHSWFCSTDDHTLQSALSGNVGLNIPGIPIGLSGGLNQQNLDSIKKNQCTSTDQSQFSQSSLNLLQKSVSDKAVEAFSDCVRELANPSAPLRVLANLDPPDVVEVQIIATPQGINALPFSNASLTAPNLTIAPAFPSELQFGPNFFQYIRIKPCEPTIIDVKTDVAQARTTIDADSACGGPKLAGRWKGTSTIVENLGHEGTPGSVASLDLTFAPRTDQTFTVTRVNTENGQVDRGSNQTATLSGTFVIIDDVPFVKGGTQVQLTIDGDSMKGDVFRLKDGTPAFRLSTVALTRTN